MFLCPRAHAAHIESSQETEVKQGKSATIVVMKKFEEQLSYRHLNSVWVKIADSPQQWLMGLVFLTVCLPILASAFVSLEWLANGWFVGSLLMVAIIFSLIYVIATIQREKQLQAFARENNLGPLHPHDALSLVPSSIRHRGHRRNASNAYTLHVGDRNIAVFDYAFTEGQGRSSRTYRFGILVFMMQKSYPHLFLDGRVNGTSTAYSKGQRISLEGDFDKYFHLYAPEQGRVAGLSIIAPDMMQALVEAGRPYDVEIEDRKIGFITNRTLYTEPALRHVLRFLQRFSEEIGHKEMSWRPVYQNDGRPMKLARRNYLRIIIIVLAVAVLLQILLQIFYYYYIV